MAASSKLQILIIGAGQGGSALLMLCMREDDIEVKGIVDINPGSIGLKMAKERGIDVFLNVEQALNACAPCIVFNMTHDQSISELALNFVDSGSVIGGHVAELFWRMITDLQKTQESLRESQARMMAVIHNVREGIISIDSQGIIEDVNPAIEKVFGYTPNELIGRNIKMLVPEPHRTSHDDYIKEYMRTGSSSIVGSSREVTAVHKDGHQFPLELSVADMDFNGTKHFVGLTRDITERKSLEAEMIRLALYDELTGLPNRTMFIRQLDFILTLKRRVVGLAAVIFIDLDRFKAVNDELGHIAGNAVLKEAGKRLQSCLRESDMAARIGGDEFMVVLTSLKGAGDAAIIAQRFIDLLNQPIQFKGKECQIGASIGIAIYPENGVDTDTLIKNSDDAMYEAKAKGKNQFCFSNASAKLGAHFPHSSGKGG